MFNLKKDIDQALKKFPALKIEPLNKQILISGLFTALGNGIQIETYNVLIGFPQSYPYAFPWVKETSGKIPKTSARHVKTDGTLCFGNLQDEAAVCKRGITFTWFLQEILNTHFCREYVREQEGFYFTGERSHGIEGVWEGYYDVFNTTNKEKILEELSNILSHQKIGRNDPCYCGSEKKYKNCHERLEIDVLDVGKEKVTRFFKVLERDYNSNK